MKPITFSRSALGKRAFAVLASTLLVASNAFSWVPAQWPECKCPDEFKTVLLAWDFENLPFGVPLPFAEPSYVSPLISASNMTGPGNVMAGTIGNVSDQWGCFAGFPANGTKGSINFKFEYTGAEVAKLCGLTFDVFSEGSPNGLHGPTQFFVNVFANGNQVWQSETVSLTPGSSNVYSWDIANPDGDNGNGDGLNLAGNFDWMNLTAGDLIAFEIVAWGANSSQVGLDLNNVQVHACVVPEPSSALMLLLGGMVLAFRTRRVMRRA
jgi:hypothetical protein